MSAFRSIFKAVKPIIGMIHLPPLPDYEGSPGMDAIIQSALCDLEVLEHFGVDGALVENEYDRPHRIKATGKTIDAMAAITKALVEKSKNCIIGVEILLNDAKASLDVAKAAGADFIRTDYFVDQMSRPGYGEFEIDPAGIIQHREKIGAQNILIMADIQVKYAKMLINRTMSESAKLAEQNFADAVVVSGRETGDAPVTNDLDQACQGCNIPVIIGSGADAGNARKLLFHCDGAIVGTALKEEKNVNAEKVHKLMRSIGRV